MEEQRKRKLLVVEDEIYLQRQIKAMLTERGYEVETGVEPGGGSPVYFK